MSSQHTGASGHGTHVIRLRGPWMLEEGPRIKLPTTWAEALGETRRVGLSRTFHRPANLAADSKVLLRVASAHAVVGATLNGQPITLAQEVTLLLEETNRLGLSLERVDSALEASLIEAQLELTEG